MGVPTGSLGRRILVKLVSGVRLARRCSLTAVATAFHVVFRVAVARRAWKFVELSRSFPHTLSRCSRSVTQRLSHWHPVITSCLFCFFVSHVFEIKLFKIRSFSLFTKFCWFSLYTIYRFFFTSIFPSITFWFFLRVSNLTNWLRCRVSFRIPPRTSCPFVRGVSGGVRAWKSGPPMYDRNGVRRCPVTYATTKRLHSTRTENPTIQNDLTKDRLETNYITQQFKKM